MSQNSFYEIGGLPYKPDTKRGQWASSSDFVYASLGHAFKMDLVTWVLPFMFLRVSVWSILAYFGCVAVFVVPIFLLQSYLGQFSSSSYVSVLRVAPAFKVIGYIGLVMNFLLLSYQSIFAGIPVIFLWNSFKYSLPWSCEEYEKWAPETGRSLSLCSTLHKDGPHFINDIDIPSVEFLRSHFQYAVNNGNTFSPYLFLCLLVVWIVVGTISFQRAAVFGRIIRYLVWISVTLLLTCVLRSLLLPESWTAMSQYFFPDPNFDHWPLLIPVVAATTFGTGWGSTISLASFNHFKANIVKYSWLVCAVQVLLMLLIGMFSYLMEFHLVSAHNLYVKGRFYKQHWEFMLCIPSALATFEYPQLWCAVFFIMLVSAAVVILATQLYAFITALTDEFIIIRTHRRLVTEVLVMSLVFTSSYFCLDHSETFFSALATDALFTQTSLNLLLLLIVLWIYGRVCFQRDFEFMLGRPFATWLVYLLRFMAPVCGLLILWFCYLAIRYQHFLSSIGLQMVAVVFIGLPWLLIPGYVLLKFLQTTGSVRMRFRRMVRATDWYPLQLEDRRRYMEMLDDLDMNQQLREIREHNADHNTVEL